MSDFATLRERMVERQLERRGIDDPALLAAFRAVPREAFVDAAHAGYAYDDSPLPIESGQTISQPYIVALMIDAAEIGEHDHVLEIGAGSGYAAAVIAQLAERVVSVERHHELARLAAARMDQLGLSNVRIVEGDGTRGFAGEAPYDAILVAASGTHVPDPLMAQLKPGGRLVMPVGASFHFQHLVKLTRRSATEFDREVLDAVAFVPLVGAQGWAEGEAR